MSLKKGVLLILVAFALTACYPISNIEKNLVPPMTGEQSESLRALIDSQYPNFDYHKSSTGTGENPKTDINNFKENKDAFYVLVQEQDRGPVHLLVLQGDVRPVILYDIQCFTEDIQHIQWADVVGDIKKELLISYYSESKSDGLFEVYAFGEKTEMLFTETFNNWVYGSLEVGKPAMLYAIVETKSKEGIRLYDLLEKDPKAGFKTLSDVHLDLNQGALDLQVGQVNASQRGIFIDGTVGAHSGLTDIVVRSEGKLVSLTQNDEGINETTFKPYYAASKDIDGDGIMEVPFMSPAIGDEELAMYETSWIYTWKSLTEKGVWENKLWTIDSYGLGSFEIPEEWVPYLGVETIYQADNSTQMTLLYDNREIREPMMTFYMVPSENFEISQYPEAIIIENKPLYVMLLKIVKGNQNKMMQLTTEEIIQSFKAEPWLNE